MTQDEVIQILGQPHQIENKYAKNGVAIECLGYNGYAYGANNYQVLLANGVVFQTENAS